MNKKFFTLIASALMLVGSVGTAKAQTYATATAATTSTEIVEGRFYQLGVDAGVGGPNLTTVLAMRASAGNPGRYELYEATTIGATLPETLWKVTVSLNSEGALSYSWMNVAHNMPLSFNSATATKVTETTAATVFPAPAGEALFVGAGNVNLWKWQASVKPVPDAANVYFYSTEMWAAFGASLDSSVTLVSTNIGVPGSTIGAVKYSNGNKPATVTNQVWLNPLNAGAVLLTVDDLNSMLWTQKHDAAESKVQFSFFDDVKNNTKDNLFSKNKYKAVWAVGFPAETSAYPAIGANYATSVGVGAGLNDYAALAAAEQNLAWAKAQDALAKKIVGFFGATTFAADKTAANTVLTTDAGMALIASLAAATTGPRTTVGSAAQLILVDPTFAAYTAAANPLQRKIADALIDFAETAYTTAQAQGVAAIITAISTNVTAVGTVTDAATAATAINNYFGTGAAGLITAATTAYNTQLTAAQTAFNTNAQAAGSRWISLMYEDNTDATKKTYLAIDTAFLTGAAGEKHLSFAHKTFADVNSKYPNLFADNLARLDLNGHYNYQFHYFPTQDSLEIRTAGFAKKQDNQTWGMMNATDNPPLGIATASVLDHTVVTAATALTDYNQVKIKVLSNQPHREVTVGPSEFTAGYTPNTTINTRITIGRKVDDNRTTLLSGLYFITLKTNDANRQTSANKYKIVHLDQDIIWAKEDDDSQLWGTAQNFGHMPATQWVVEQHVYGDGVTNLVNIYNREYPVIRYENVQLYKVGTTGNIYMPFAPSVPGYTYTQATPFIAQDSLSFATVASVKPGVTAAYLDKYLGYFHYDSLKLSERQYALNYMHGFSKDGYIKLYDSATDSLIRVEVTTGTSFELELASGHKDESFYGYYGRLNNATTNTFERLKRTAYVIRVKDPNLLIVDGKYIIKIGNPATGEAMYAVSNLPKNDERIARFFLKENNRGDVVNKDGSASNVPFFALVDAYNPTLGAPVSHIYPNLIGRTDTVWYESNYNTNGHNNTTPVPVANPFVRVGVKDGSLLFTQELQTGEIRVAAFALRPAQNYLYRRFDGGTYGPLTEPYKGADATNIDSPLYLKFFKYNNRESIDEGVEYLSENSVNNVNLKNYRDSLVHNKAISFAGLYNKYQYNEEASKLSYEFYVDTAYVRYETLMPQYMLALRESILEKDTTWCQDPHHAGQTHLSPDWINCPHTVIRPRLVRADWLFNAQDSVNVGNQDYEGKWSYGAYQLTRLAFVPGVHAMDTFYVLRDKDLIAKKADQIRIQDLWNVPAEDKHYLGENTHFTERWKVGKYTAARATQEFRNKNTAGAYTTYNDNYNGKSMVFQFRLIDENDRRFLIESTRDAAQLEPQIGPYKGRWVKIQNGVPVMSDRDMSIGKAQQNGAEIWDVTQKEPNFGTISNEEVAADVVKVIAGYGEVTVYGAAGKKVTVSNVLGQAVANTVANSDQATIQLPKGIVIVAVDGEKAIKAVVK